MRTLCFLALGILCLVLPGVAQQKDNVDCKDHPLFTRMPDSWIHSCTVKAFNSYAFQTGKGKTTQVEGTFSQLRYYPQNTASSKPSDVQILRNFENAVTRQGGTLVAKEAGKETLEMTKDGKEIWVEVWADFTGKYGLTIVERNAMTQDVVANAAAFATDLATNGHASLYGIYFDTGKSDLKVESNQAIGEIATLLKNDASLQLYVVGHTDNVGALDANMKLSMDRANAVVQALIATHGIASSRVKPFGAGSYAPVASNDSEAGRARNRRVELVKQ